MARVIHQLQQGTPAWHQHRAVHFNAADAPTMLGLGLFESRSDLVARLATGAEREMVDPHAQRRFDDGHQYEAQARPWAEEIVGEDLFPIVASLDVDGLPLSASFDGVTINEDVTFEHKTANADLLAALARDEVPDGYWPQLEQQLLVLGAERCLFMASAGNRDAMKYVWYASNPARRARVIAGWKQLQEDVRNYQHVEVLPRAVAEPQAELPVPAIEVSGEVAIHSNLASWGEQLRAYLKTIPATPSTDQEFANCEAACKALKTAEDRMKLAVDTALARLTDIDEMRTLAAQSIALARDNRLTLEKLVEARKKTIRAEILQDGQRAYASYLEKLNARLGLTLLNGSTVEPPDFATAMKGKKTVASLRDAVNTALANAKIAANEVADGVEVNLKHLAAQGAEYRALFADVATIAFKEREHFELVVRTRIDAHKEALRKQAEAEAEKAREKIAAEERAKAEAEQRLMAAETSDSRAARFTDVTVMNAQPLPPPIEISRIPTYDVKTARPDDDEIIEVLALHWRVHESKVIEWLLAMDLKAASERMVANI